MVEDALLAIGLETDVPLEFVGDVIWMVEPSKALDEEGGGSADISGGGSDWVEATLKGPGYLTFKWRLEAGRAPEEFEEFNLACSMDEE